MNEETPEFRKLDKEAARKLLDALPEGCSAEEMAHAIYTAGQFRHGMGYQELAKNYRQQEQQAQKKPSVFSEYSGCIFSVLGLVALFIFMPLLFTLGEKMTGGRGREIKEGKVMHIELDPAMSSESLVGRKCKVYAEWVWFDGTIDAHDRMIPTARIRYLDLQED